MKADDYSINKRTKAVAVLVASTMGKFVEFDEFDPIGWSKYMQFRVDLSLDKALIRVMRIVTSSGSKWIKFK